MKFLYIVSDFLPNYNGGTIRAIKNTKYFYKSGLRPIIFTQKLDNLSSFETINEINIIRSNSYDLANVYIKIKHILRFKGFFSKKFKVKENNVHFKNKGRLADLFFLPDIKILWALFGIPKARKIVNKNAIKLLYSSGPSHSCHIIALFKKSNKKLKWIAEFRDPWITNPFRDPKWYLFEKIDQWLEKLTLQNANVIIVTSQNYVHDIRNRFPAISKNKIQFIPNGFDLDDFVFLKYINKVPNKKFTIISTGNYYQKRSLLPFLSAISLFLDRYPYFNEKIQFINYGNVDEASEIYLNKNPIHQVQLRKFISHKECILEMYNADLLLVIPGPGIGTMPGKTYEYLASGTVILALVDEGPSKQLIEDMNAGLIVGSEDIEGIVEALHLILKFGFKSKRTPESDELLKKYNRSEIAHQIINTIVSL